MKKIILTGFIAFLSTSIFAYDIVSNAVQNVKGAAKSVTRTDFTIASKFGEYFRTPNTKYVYKFNGLQQVTESSELNARDGLMNKITNTYDSNGNVINEICFDSENTQIWNTEITYKDGKKVDSTEYSAGGSLKGKSIYSYTGNNLTDESYYNGDGVLVWKIVSKYAGNKIEVEDEYSGEGMLVEERHYAYNRSGNLDTISYSDSTGTVVKKDVFRYDDKGVLNEITTYNAEGKTIRRTLVKTDEKGNIAKVTVYNVARKFGTTVNEMADMSEFVYEY